MADSTSLPASLTKHLDSLTHPLPRQVSNPTSSSVILQQSSSPGADTTGTTLWLGAQVLAAYLAETLAFVKAPSSAESRRKVIELGGGVGFLAIVIAAMGYEVTTTDINPPMTQVLQPNIERNASRMNLASPITVAELDWCNLPSCSSPFDESGIPDPRLDVEHAFSHVSERHPWNQAWDVIVTTDTIYHVDLVQPLLRWIRILSIASQAVSSAAASAAAGNETGLDPHPDNDSTDNGHPPTTTYPPVYVALENRDPHLVANALALALRYGFTTKRISQSRVDKCLAKTGWSWDPSLKPDYDGIQIWKWRYSGSKT